MKAVILAGGLGIRLHPFTKAIPKPLLPIGEKAVLELQIERLVEFGFNEIFLATNYKSKYIEKFFINNITSEADLRIVKEDKPLGTAGPITLLKETLTEPFILMNGDVLTLIDFSKFYNYSIEKNCCLTVAIKKHITPFDFGNIFFDGDSVTGIEEKKDIVSYVLAGIYVLTPEVFQHIPEHTYYGMDELIINLLNQNIPITKYEMEEYWLDIGMIDNYEKAEQDFFENLKKR